MRLPLVLLALAALLSWAAMRLETFDLPERGVVAATRTSAPRAPETRTSARPDETDLGGAPPLFRDATPLVTTPRTGEVFSLVGLAGEPNAQVAFLQDQADGRTFTARIGEEVRGWIVEEANERCVVLRRGRRRENACL